MKFQSDKSLCENFILSSLVLFIVVQCGDAEFDVKQLTKLWTLANRGTKNQGEEHSAGDSPSVITPERNAASVRVSSSDNRTNNDNKPTDVYSVTNGDYNYTINNFVKRPTQRPEENMKSRSISFKPRSIPLSWKEETPQIERNFVPKFVLKNIVQSAPSRRSDKLYKDNVYMEFTKNKTDILFPGNYFNIAEVKRKDVDHNTHSTVRKSSAVYPSSEPVFRPKIIPLLRGSERRRSDGRSIDERETTGALPATTWEQSNSIRRSGGSYIDRREMTVALPVTTWEQSTYPVQSRTIGDFIPDDDLEEDLDEEEGVEDEEEKDSDDGEEKKKGHKIKKKYMKYMLPLLLAYKLKFFTLIPLLMGGLVLLAGSTGLAGFFFALFAAVMGLSKSIH